MKFHTALVGTKSPRYAGTLKNQARVVPIYGFRDGTDFTLLTIDLNEPYKQ